MPESTTRSDPARRGEVPRSVGSDLGWLAAIAGIFVLLGVLSGCEAVGLPEGGGEPSAEGTARAVQPGDFVSRAPSVVAATGPVETTETEAAPEVPAAADTAGGADAHASADANAQGSATDADAVAPGGATLPAPVVILGDASDMDHAPAGSTAGAASASPRPPTVVDGMVGQINGRAIYADDILGGLEEQLRTLGQRKPTSVFRQQAREQINGLIRGRLINALILGEAERSLTENEWNGVRFMQAKKREELLRLHGQGSLARTEKVLREETGLGLDATLSEYRDGLITETYIRRNINAKINVSRRDIERYYAEHPEEFNPRPRRDVVVIRVADPAAADDVADRLAGGQSFSTVAADPENAMAAAPVMRGLIGDKPFGRPEVDAALSGLSVGKWAGPIAVGSEFWFVFLDDEVRPEAVSMIDAQAKIERALQQQQFIQLRKKFIDRLLREGSFTQPEKMVAALVDIAVNRYAGG